MRQAPHLDQAVSSLETEPRDSFRTSLPRRGNHGRLGGVNQRMVMRESGSGLVQTHGAPLYEREDPARSSWCLGALPQGLGASPELFSEWSLKLPSLRPISITGWRNQPSQAPHTVLASPTGEVRPSWRGFDEGSRHSGSRLERGMSEIPTVLREVLRDRHMRAPLFLRLSNPNRASAGPRRTPRR